MSVWGNPVALGGAGGSANIQALSITQNGTYTASGVVDGYSPVTVAVPGGGGGSTNVLSGASAPSVAQGRNGAVYLKYIAVPSEYTRLEYIQSDGNQYIDTQYTPTALTSVELKLNPQNVQESAILGANWAMNGFFLMFYQSKFRWHSGSSADSATISANTDYMVVVNSTSLYVNGTRYSVTAGTPYAAAIRLFSTTVAGGSGASNTKGSFKLYYVNIYEDGALAMQMVPVKRNADDELGLYDLVGGAFYGNGGTGSFTSGPSASENPIAAAYAKVSGVWQALIGTDINDIDLGGGGGTERKGFELAFANGEGNTQAGGLFLDNSYFVCYFDDNMSSTYTLNGASRTMSVVASGNQQTLADTLEVTNPQVQPLNAMLDYAGSTFVFHHGDSGSYCSVVGGWTGYPTGGTIYKQATYGTQNVVTLAEAHGTLLVFIGACGSLSSYNTVSVNGVSYTVTNIGNHYGQIAIYGAIELDGNTDTTVTVALPVSCYSFVSVVGLD